MSDDTTWGSEGDDEEVEDLRIIPPESTGGDEVELPHWTAPASGEQEAVSDAPPDDSAETWNALSTSGPRWRDAGSDFDEADDIRLLAEDHPQASGVGATDSATGEQFFGDEDTFNPTLMPPGASGAQDIPPAPPLPPPAAPEGVEPQPAPSEKGRDRDMGTAIITGLVLAGVAVVCFLIGSGITAAFATLLLLVAGAEFFNSVHKVGYQPATLLGLAAIGGLSGAVYWRGVAAYPIVLFLIVVFAMLWYLLGVSDERPVPNLGVTMLGVMYVGMLGSFAALLLAQPDGIGLLLAPVIAAVGYDVGAFLVGRSAGKSPLSDASPNKTVEGLVGGCIAAIAATVAIVGIGGIEPWGDTPGSLSDTIILAIVAAIAAPLGDLCESVLKRDLGVKDMGNILPAHGGLLDRFDSLLFVMPASFCAALLLDII